jgi:hypothetical protein
MKFVACEVSNKNDINDYKNKKKKLRKGLLG